jgi:hypothetical protein
MNLSTSARTVAADRSAPIATANHLPPHAEIAARAYEKYLSSGRCEGRCEQDWLEAERELSAELATRAAHATKPNPVRIDAIVARRHTDARRAELRRR